MSAAKPPAAAAQPYAVSRPAGRCAVTGQALPPGTPFMAMLKDTAAGLERVDVSLDAWPQVDAAEALAYWRAVMPQPDQVKKKPFVDDETLVTLFERLADTDEPHKIHFRFVLGLILMRKRVLLYEASDHVDGRDVWVIRRKGSDVRLKLLNPHLSEDQVAAVSTQLGQIMNEEL